MIHFEIVAHRGYHIQFPENTITSFESAIALGADAVELDIRLTADRLPILFHYYYLDEITTLQGPVFEYTLEQLHNAEFLSMSNSNWSEVRIPTLQEVLEGIGGRTGLEIEIKGPEPEAPEIIGNILCNFKHLWDGIEVTSYEPIFLLNIQEFCPGLSTDLLIPRNENWMRNDVVLYNAINKARLAKARAVHLHPMQLNVDAVSSIHNEGIEVHAWDVNDVQSLQKIVELGIPRISTDFPNEALIFRDGLFSEVK
jgi:glycerophosphoryl diester phosphodiesterase